MKYRKRLYLFLAPVTLFILGCLIVFPLFDVEQFTLANDAFFESAWVNTFARLIMDTGHIPTWTNIVGFGISFPGKVPPFFLVVPTLLEFITHNAVVSYNICAILFFAGSSVTAYFLARKVTGNLIPAVFAGILYMILPMHYEILSYGMVSVLLAYALIPFVTYLCIRWFEKADAVITLKLAIAEIVLFLLQPEYFIVHLLIVLVLAATSLSRRKKIVAELPGAQFLLLVGIFLIGTSPYTIPLIKSLGMYGFENAADAMKRFSYGSLTQLFVVPDLRQYWGFHNTGYDSQIGIISILVTTVVLAIAHKLKNRYLMAFVTLALLGFALSFGRNISVNSIFFSLPLLKEFRVATRFYVLTAISVPILGAMLITSIKTVKIQVAVSMGLLTLLTLSFYPYVTNLSKRFVTKQDYTISEDINNYINAPTKDFPTRIYDVPCNYNMESLSSFNLEIFCNALDWAENKDARIYKQGLVEAIGSGNSRLINYYLDSYKVDFLLFQYRKRIPERAIAYDAEETNEHVNKLRQELMVETTHTHTETFNSPSATIDLVKLTSRPKIATYPTNSSAIKLFAYDDALDFKDTIYRVFAYDIYTLDESIIDDSLFVKKQNALAIQPLLNGWTFSSTRDPHLVDLLRQKRVRSRVSFLTADFEIASNGFSYKYIASEDTIQVVPYQYLDSTIVKVDGVRVDSFSANTNLIGFISPIGRHSIEVSF